MADYVEGPLVGVGRSVSSSIELVAPALRSVK